MEKNIVIIGTGKMGKALARGFLDKNVATVQQLTLTKPHTDDLMEFKERGVRITTQNIEGIKMADVIILAVKPQIISDVITEIKPFVTNKHLVISIAAGVTIAKIEKIIGNDKSIIRVMPNLCAQIGESVSAWTKNKNVDRSQEDLIIKLLEAVGTQVLVSDEKLINSVTAVSASGLAYFFYITQALEKAAEELGLTKEAASKLSLQTLIGSALLIKSTGQSPENLTASVASKGGTTEAALKSFNENGLDKIFIEGVKAASHRAEELNSD